MTYTPIINILLVEDHPLYRIGLRMTLSYLGLNCVVVAEAGNVKQATEYLESHPDKVDLILLDYFLPDGTGKDVLNAVNRICPKVKVLLVSGEDNIPDMDAMMKTGLNGFVSKDATPQGMAMAISSVFERDGFIGKNGLPERHEGQVDQDNTLLSRREIEIVRLCALGKSAKQIAELLFISVRTVEAHKHAIFSKLGCNSTNEMVNYALLNGLI